MGLATLRANQLIRWRNQIFKLVGRLPDGNWHMVDVVSGLIDKQSDDDLWSAFERKELVFVCDEDCRGTAEKDGALKKPLADSPSSNITASPPRAEKERARSLADDRWRIVKATLGLGRRQIAMAIGKICCQIKWPLKPPHPSSVLNWRKKALNSGDPISALVDRNDKKGWRDHDENLREILRKVRDDAFLQQNPRITVAEAVKKARDRVILENDKRPPSNRFPRLPGRRLMESVIEEVDERERYAKRYGADAALIRFRFGLGGIHTEAPLDRCEFDHTVLAVVVLDEDYLPWGRGNCSICIDGAIPVPTGIYWGAETSSIVSVAHAIDSSLRPKIAFLKDFPNVKGSWPCYGVAKTYVGDNGLEEHAKALRQALSEIGGSTLELCGRKRAWFKPNVERYFRTQDLGLLQTIPGATMENILTRCNFDPKRDVLIRQSTFGRILIKWTVDVYMREPLARLHNQSPIEEWKKRIIGVDQFVPSKSVLLERLFFRKVESRRLDHEGVEYDCLVYNNHELGALRAQLGAVLSVSIWVSDENLGYIHVCVPNSDLWIRVNCLDQKYADGLTRWQHEKCKQMRRVGRDEGRELSLAQARKEIEDEIANDVKEFHHANRKRRARFNERRPSRPVETPTEGAHADIHKPSNDPPVDADDLLADADQPIEELDSTVAK